MSEQTPLALALICVACLLLTGCAGSTSLNDNGKAPPAKRRSASVIVSKAGDPLTTGIRRALATRGWRLIGYKPELIQGEHDAKKMAKQAAYRVVLSGTQVGDCNSGKPSVLYRIALIDNRTGTLTLAMSGAKCLPQILRDFQRQLDEKRFTPPYFDKQRTPKQPRTRAIEG